MEAQVVAIESFPSILFFLHAPMRRPLSHKHRPHFGKNVSVFMRFYRKTEIGTTGLADNKYADVRIRLSAAQVWRTKNQLFG